MNKDIFMWKIKQMVWDIKEKWADLTDDDLKGVDNKDQLVWKIQERYWHAKEDVEKEVNDFADKLMKKKS